MTMDRIKGFLAWVYDWLVTITSLAVGALSVVPDLLMAIGAIDFTPILGAHRAAQIVTVVAILKAAVAIYRSRKATA